MAARGPLRLLWLAGGLIAVGLAIIGAILPLVPTTPFLLVAAYAFARSSPRLHAWLLSHRHFGPLIRNWRDHGAIGRRTKYLSIAVMAAMPPLSLALGAPAPAIAVQIPVLIAAGAFILTRPTGPH